MSVLKKEAEFLHPLTDKWMPLINRFASRYNKPLLGMIQEAYIIEWQMQQNKKFVSEKHKENYFNKALYRNLYRRVNAYPHEWGIMEAGHNIIRRKKPIMDKYGKKVNYVREDQVSFIASDKIVSIIDSLIQMRPFDEIYYSELINHTTALLAQKNALAARIFLDRMGLQIKWKELRLKLYKDTNLYQFNKAVRLIRSVVRKEVSIV